MYPKTKAILVSAALILSGCTFFQDGGSTAKFGVDFQNNAAPEPVHGDEVGFSLAVDAAQPILDLIGFTEGTDKGDGYNETLAYGAFTNGDVHLTDMTLAEIDALQTEMLAHPENSWSSSAIGRYQIVRTTLRKLKNTLQLADTLKFTPELQDRLAIELLKGRGYEAWFSGTITDQQFALNMSKEWASLPNPHTDTGYYSGQNAAVSYAKVEAVLSEAR